MSKILFHPADYSACGNYRIAQRADIYGRFINPTGAILASRYLNPVELMGHEISASITHRQLSYTQVSNIKSYKERNVFILNDLDDLLWQTPPNNPFTRSYTKEIQDSLRSAMRLADRQISSTEPLREEIFKFSRVESVVLPNMLMPSQYCEKIDKSDLEQFTVLWSGSVTHQDDLFMLAGVVDALPDVKFVFLGYVPENVRKFKNVEYHAGVDFNKYTNYLKFHASKSHIAIAPLMPCRFNETKSNLKLLEYGANNLPVIATDIYPYQEANVKIKWDNKQTKKWINAIMEYKENQSLLDIDSDKSRKYADSFNAILPENIYQVQTALAH